MTQVTIAEAQECLPGLLAAVRAGEKVMIRTDEGDVFQLTTQSVVQGASPAWPGYPQPGSAKGLLRIADDFDEPLEELKEYME
jgi:antitoxin (DNA-binding transcriptional repressor) of toxin-antitoxin stability system